MTDFHRNGGDDDDDDVEAFQGGESRPVSGTQSTRSKICSFACSVAAAAVTI